MKKEITYNGKKVNVELNDGEFIAWTTIYLNGLPAGLVSGFIAAKTKKEAMELRRKYFLNYYKSESEMNKHRPLGKYIFTGKLGLEENVPVCSIDERIEEMEEKQETINKVGEIIAAAEKYKNAYFFTPPASASSRRWLEEKYNLPEVEWKEGNDTYTASFSLECSCRNIYTSSCYTKNGKVTNLTAIRNSYKRLVNNI